MIIGTVTLLIKECDKLDDDIQIGLQLPELKRTETRQALAAYFERYREYRLILRMGGVYPSTVQRLPHSANKPGYEPDLIRAQNSFSSSTENSIMRNERLAMFVSKLERKVDALPEYKREILWRRFMADCDPLPTDDEVHNHLADIGYTYSMRYYLKKKGQALMTLAYALGVEQEDYGDSRWG